MVLIPVAELVWSIKNCSFSAPGVLIVKEGGRKTFVITNYWTWWLC